MQSFTFTIFFIAFLATVKSLPLPITGEGGGSSHSNSNVFKLSDSGASFILMDTPDEDFQRHQQTFVISPVTPGGGSSLYNKDPSELAQLLPEFFRFVESLMVIISNTRPPLQAENLYRIPSYESYATPPDFGLRYPPFRYQFVPPSSIPPYAQFPKLYQTLPEYPEYADPDSSIGLIAGRSEDASAGTTPSTGSMSPARHLDKYCVFQGVSTFNQHDCFKYLVCIPTLYNRFEAFVASCPEDKRFSATYRRCVQPYLVPQCYHSSHPAITGYHHKGIAKPELKVSSLSSSYLDALEVDEALETDNSAANSTAGGTSVHSNSSTAVVEDHAARDDPLPPIDSQASSVHGSFDDAFLDNYSTPAFPFPTTNDHDTEYFETSTGSSSTIDTYVTVNPTTPDA